jgi:hypothetical protein
VIALFHHPPIAPAGVVDDYPAHLHIDLLERSAAAAGAGG